MINGLIGAHVATVRGLLRYGDCYGTEILRIRETYDTGAPGIRGKYGTRTWVRRYTAWGTFEMEDIAKIGKDTQYSLVCEYTNAKILNVFCN